MRMCAGSGVGGLTVGAAVTVIATALAAQPSMDDAIRSITPLMLLWCI